ncbi:MAG: FAD-binding oxidoreductase [Candidatus Promineifilaceae bacterium]|nr:FAD-binding oxidoreductase [Candidatus Promineifilaceae bacterium]
MPSGKRRRDEKASAQQLEALAAVVEGQVIRPDGGAEVGTEGPTLVVRCAGAADVAAGVRFAKENGLPLNVKDGPGVVVDLSGMKQVEVAAEARRVWVQAGATVADVDRATQRYGLATPTGLPSTANVVGLTLSGGGGWLRRLYGASLDNVLGLEVVTANGRAEVGEAGAKTLLRNPDAGIVTAVSFRLYPLGPEVVLLTAVYALPLARAALYTWRDWTRTAPRAASTDFFFWDIPAAAPFPRSLHNKPVVVVAGLFVGEVRQGLNTFQPLRELSKPLIDLTGPTPYVAAQSAFDPFLPPGTQFDTRQRRLPALDDERVEGILTAIVKGRPRQTLLAIRHLASTGDGARDAYLLSATPAGGEDEGLRPLWDELAAV